ncbi:Spindle assembly checkpoint component MAD3 [Dirofilaria immitis]
MPPPPPFGQYFVPAASSRTPTDRTELRSAQIGASGAKNNKEATEKTGKAQVSKQTLVSAAADYDEEGSKYTIAQKRCMVISCVMVIFFFITAIAAIVVLITGFRIFR